MLAHCTRLVYYIVDYVVYSWCNNGILHNVLLHSGTFKLCTLLIIGCCLEVAFLQTWYFYLALMTIEKEILLEE